MKPPKKSPSSIPCKHGRGCWSGPGKCRFTHKCAEAQCKNTPFYYCAECSRRHKGCYLCWDCEKTHVGQGRNGNWHDPKPLTKK